MIQMRLHYLVILLGVLELTPTAVSRSVLEPSQTGSGVRTQRDASCLKLGYLHDNICCLYCPAGTYVKEFCTQTLEKGTCETCDFDSYTEHENGLPQCLKCTKCRSDEQITKRCTVTQNTECQCKPGSFCASDQACEVCKKCSRCKENEVEVSKCNSTSNTACIPRLPTAGTITGTTASQAWLIVGAVFVIVFAVSAVIVWKKRKSCKTRSPPSKPGEPLIILVDDQNSGPIEENQNNRNAVLEAPLLVRTQAVGATVYSTPEDEDNGLGDSLPNTSHSSQSSLSAIPLAPLPRYSPLSSAKWQPDTVATEEDLLRNLTPLNGDESLRKSFELFEELDVLYHKRFFRHLGLRENAINSCDYLPLEERVYKLLNIWLEKVGMQADLNHLIKALLHFDQRLSAENIISKAIKNGYYEYAEM